MTQEVKGVIDRVETMPKQGDSYDHMGRHGWRNPIRSDTGLILQALVLARRPWRMLEIGTGLGLSGCYLASALPKGATMTTIEWEATAAEIATMNFSEAKLPVSVMVGDALKILPTLEEQFDFVFMDANKDGYLEQLMLLQSHRLLYNNCIIVADNVIDRQTECQNFLDYMLGYPHVIINTECGLLVGRI